MNGTRPMITAEAVASIAIAPILPFIALRSRSLGEVAHRLGELPPDLD